MGVLISHFRTLYLAMAHPGCRELDVQSAFDLLSEVTDTFTLGLQLGIKPAKLKEIERNHCHDVQRQKQETIAAWLACDPSASWEDLVEALVKMDEHTTAKKISEYLQSRAETGVSTLDPQEEVCLEIVKRNTSQIKQKYAHLVILILDQLEQMRTDVRRLRVYVSNFPASRKFENMLLFQHHLRDIREASSLDELFMLLGQYEYWRWDNYHLLSSIVDSFGSPQMQEMVKTYRKELDAFRINTKLCRYVEVVGESKQVVPRPDFETLLVKLNVRWSEYTLKCVEQFWESLIEEFSLAPYALTFRGAKPGCVCLLFLFPSVLTPWLVLESKGKVGFFAKSRIQSLKIAQFTVFDIDAKDEDEEEGGPMVSLTPCSLQEAGHTIDSLLGRISALDLRVQDLEADKAKAKETIIELTAKHIGMQSRLTDATPTSEATPIPTEVDGDTVIRREGKSVRLTWTINLNGFFYNHIYNRNSQALPSELISQKGDKHEYQLIVCPRSMDRWRNRHCSLFVYLDGQDVKLPAKIVIQCRVPGVEDDEEICNFFVLEPKEDDVGAYEDGYLIARLYNFISYSFFFKHLNVAPYFQVVADFTFT